MASIMLLATGAIFLRKTAPAALPPVQAQTAKGVVQTAPEPETTAPISTEVVVSSTDQTAQSAPPPPDVVLELPSKRMPALESLSDDTDVAWVSLGARWRLNLKGNSACAEALTQGHQCFRTLGADLAVLKALDRPGLAQFRKDGVERWVELTRWKGDTVTIAQGKANWQIPTAEFAELWTGRFTTFWRQPLDQTSRIYAVKPDEPAGRWLETELQKLQTKGQLHTAADSPEKRVIAFQKQYGLNEGDGKALPSTFIKINQLVGVSEPKLSR